MSIDLRSLAERAGCRYIQADIKRLGIVAPIVGHVGDGNFHLVVLFDPNDAAERAKADRLCVTLWVE